MRLSFQDVFLRTSSEKERLLKVFRKNCGGKTVKHLFSTYIFYTMRGCRTLLKEALGSRTLWRFKSVLSCLGARSSCQIAVPELLGVQGLQVVLLAVASVSLPVAAFVRTACPCRSLLRPTWIWPTHFG